VRTASSHGVSRLGVTCILCLTDGEDALGRFVFCFLRLGLCALNVAPAVLSMDRNRGKSTPRASMAVFCSKLPKT
jgi:hypothetical protein